MEERWKAELPRARQLRIALVCRVGKRPRQDIETRAPSRAVANNDVEELAASSI